jgi:4-diphosphocytidyl-2C-methyl-D-erythritol kinase
MKAYAKVNFILKVFPKTPQETKHKIKSWFCLYPKLYDQVLIRNASKTTIECKYDNQNISINQKPILLVIEYLAKLAKCKINLHIIIHKNIPPMSGLGGSATDIACIIN